MGVGEENDFLYDMEDENFIAFNSQQRNHQAHLTNNNNNFIDSQAVEEMVLSENEDGEGEGEDEISFDQTQASNFHMAIAAQHLIKNQSNRFDDALSDIFSDDGDEP